MSGILQGVLASIGGAPATYIEDVFSTYLYTGNGGTQTITNGIDLAGEGGMVWTKSRSQGTANTISDTVRGREFILNTNATTAETSSPAGRDLVSFNSNGFTVGPVTNYFMNANGQTYVGWTFREQPKFFDVVTYTGNGVARNISHNLDSVPGMIIIKLLNQDSDWVVYHRGMPNTDYLYLNTTIGASEVPDYWNDTTPTSTTFRVNTNSAVNSDGQPYVAYLFAHDAGGFGLSGNENVISCGSYTGNGSSNGPTINLGYEPQWVLQKRIDSSSNWHTQDIMRGMPVTGNTALLLPNSATGEYDNIGLFLVPNATGFQIRTTDPAYNANGGKYIYMAIRRGPMATPTSGTSVFAPVTLSGNSSGSYNATINPDLSFVKWQSGSQSWWWVDRLRGNNITLNSDNTSAEATNAGYLALAGQANNTVATIFANGNANATWNFRRAPGFFDQVCYTGNGTQRNLTHNLGKAPGMVIVRGRSSNTAGEDWAVWHQNGSQANGFLGARLNTTQAYGNYGQSLWQNDTTAPDMNASTISLGTNDIVNGSAKTYVAYLFGEVAGVSKVGSYAGTGATQTINCGFTGGARFVLIKRSNDSGNWFVWDTARGMVAGTDPFLLLNTTDPESNINAVYTVSTGFQIVSTNAELNASGSTYIYLAIA